MIGKLSGIIDEIMDGRVIVNVGGVGYLVSCSARTLRALGQKGDAAALLIDTAVREDAITLYGFMNAQEQQWFRLLTSVQGVGAKAGMAILSVCAPEQLGYIIASGDKAALNRADGVGPKLAARILTELKDRVEKMAFAGAPLKPNTAKEQPSVEERVEASLEQDAVSALVNLGYARTEAYSAVIASREKANDNLQDLIRLALKELNGR